MYKRQVKDEIRGNRDRYLASLRARETAGALPEELDQMIRAFRESRIVHTALELDVFTAVAGSVDCGAVKEEVAARIGADPRATGMLLDALTAMGLLTKAAEHYATTAVSGRFLAAGGRDDARAALLHNSSLWDRWSHLTECVKAGTSVTYRELADREDSWTKPFIAAMHRNATGRAPLVVSAVGTAAGSGPRRLLDVGGGSGAYAIAFAQANPDLTAEVLDLPTVLPITKEHVRVAGLEARVRTREGDLRRDPLGSGYDLVLVSAICHMLGEDENRDLLRRCATALTAGGRLVIQDFFLEADRTAPKSAALFSINMLVGTERGSSYSEKEYAAWLGEAGLQDIRRVRLPGPSGLMIATKGSRGSEAKLDS